MTQRETSDIDVIAGAAESRIVEGRAILLLPKECSDQLPTRGQVAVDANLNGTHCDLVVEPDGRRGHWINLPAWVCDPAKDAEGSRVEFRLRVSERWPEPDVPDDLQAALDTVGQNEVEIVQLWGSITPRARWEWVRWIGATRNPATRNKRIDVAIDKMRKGNRRPCCFDLSSCTDAQLARSAKLIVS